MKQTRWTYVKFHKRGTGKRCMHCSKNAKWTAVRKADLKMAVHYCSHHKVEIIDKNGNKGDTPQGGNE